MKPTFALCNSALHYLFACDYANFLSSKFQCSESVFMPSPLMDRYPEQHNGRTFILHNIRLTVSKLSEQRSDPKMIYEGDSENYGSR